MKILPLYWFHIQCVLATEMQSMMFEIIVLGNKSLANISECFKWNE